MSFAEVSVLRVPLRRVVVTTVELDDLLEDLAFRDLLILIHPRPKGGTAF